MIQRRTILCWAMMCTLCKSCLIYSIAMVFASNYQRFLNSKILQMMCFPDAQRTFICLPAFACSVRHLKKEIERWTRMGFQLYGDHQSSQDSGLQFLLLRRVRYINGKIWFQNSLRAFLPVGDARNETNRTSAALNCWSKWLRDYR